MNILGLAFLSDASACVLKDGEIIAAVSEERLNRVKLWNGIPQRAAEAVLRLAGIGLEEIDLIATHGACPAAPEEAPYSDKENRIRKSGLSPERAQAQINHLRSRLEHERMVLGKRTPGYLAEMRALGKPVVVVGHHEAHAASAYFGSGWENCAVLTADGWGEDGSSTIWLASGGKMQLRFRSHSFDSLGYFYGSITKALGFIPHRHEGKVLGLAAHCSKPKSYPVIRAMIDYDRGEKRFLGRMENGYYIPRFENPYLKEFVQSFSREDVASAAQQSLEEVVCACVEDLGDSANRLALAGGVFANVKLNQRLARLKNIKEIRIFPNMGDGGLSVGAAWQVYWQKTGKMPKRLSTLYLGQESSEKEMEQALRDSGCRFEKPAGLEKRVASLLSERNVVAICRGRMEYGPRALGNRSILYPARDPGVNDWLNQRLARSDFMPFAPATLEEYGAQCYTGLSAVADAVRFMTTTCDCTDFMRKDAPAAVHVDGTARPQLVSMRDSRWFHTMLSAYHQITGSPSVINTSFNMHEEPIVCTATDALRAFRASALPYLVLGDFLVEGEKDSIA